MRKFDNAVMTGCRGILKKAAVRVLANLFGLQNFRSHLQPNDSTFPIKLVLLDVVKAIRLVIDWCPERWWRDLFFGRRIIARAIHDFLARLREHRHLAVRGVLGLPVGMEDERILLKQFRG